MRTVIVVTLFCLGFSTPLHGESDEFFRDQVAPILSQRCLSCHSDGEAKGGLSLSTASAAMSGGDNGPVIVKSAAEDSILLDYVSGDEPEMPKDGEPLSAQQIETIRRWIAHGANWPEGYELEPPAVTDTNWWSLLPLEAPDIPDVPWELADTAINPVDCFVFAKLVEKNLQPSPLADRRTLIRRVYFDLLGLPPDPDVIRQFVNDPNPLAYEQLIDDLLASPHYGERWGRHWLDVVHYGDTHGYDKDKLRPNAWPYRDYVIRSLNADKPYRRFVQEQIAGDALWPETRDGIEATGFIAAGPWDFIGHAEVPEEKIDGQVARNLDRDDMVTSTMNTFISTTVQCARCHNHKFDPITQEHYYGMQSVFAALDRADREYDVDEETASQRRELVARRDNTQNRLASLDERIRARAGQPLIALDKRLAELSQKTKSDPRPQFGYHSQIVADQDTTKWVQVDLGATQTLSGVTIVGCHDDFAGIGAGFGFPPRFRIEVSDDPTFDQDVETIVDQTFKDYANPGVTPQSFRTDASGRYIRVTATKLAKRSNDYIFALGELIAVDTNGQNIAADKTVTALDSIEAPVRWQKVNLVDGYYHGGAADAEALAELNHATGQRDDMIAQVTTEVDRSLRDQLTSSLDATTKELAALPPRQRVYAGMIHTGSGAFRGRGHVHGKPRDVFVLVRGDVRHPGDPAHPGTMPVIPSVNWRFDLPPDHREHERRIQLAEWLIRYDHPLTWRSIVNRVWQYHFGMGIVETPNDFGRMGAEPSHPELLDWLAAEFRDGGQSLKQLHRTIVTSYTYRQQSANHSEFSAIDAENRYLWRMNRRALDAESIRDATLAVSDRLNAQMYGEGFRDFVLERPEHSPHYEYHKHDPNDPKSHRRAVYRFLVRSQQQPFMQTLDCADPSQSVARRDTSITAIQALTLLNNKFIVQMSEHFAASLSAQPTVEAQVDTAYQRVTGRVPNGEVIDDLVSFTKEFGLANTCRMLLNLNDFVFVD